MHGEVGLVDLGTWLVQFCVVGVFLSHHLELYEIQELLWCLLWYFLLRRRRRFCRHLNFDLRRFFLSALTLISLFTRVLINCCFDWLWLLLRHRFSFFQNGFDGLCLLLGLF